VSKEVSRKVSPQVRTALSKSESEDIIRNTLIFVPVIALGLEISRRHAQRYNLGIGLIKPEQNAQIAIILVKVIASFGNPRMISTLLGNGIKLKNRCITWIPKTSAIIVITAPRIIPGRRNTAIAEIRIHIRRHIFLIAQTHSSYCKQRYIRFELWLPCLWYSEFNMLVE
jgi:hypothetical protein